MREILFKAKTINGKRWVQGYFFAKPILERYFIICDEAQWEVDPNTLCQYTGLTDKNGNKIWENDLVEIPAENGYFLVEWSNTEAQWQMDNEEDRLSVDFDNYWHYEVEVVGNAFDNADLMKG